MQFSTKLAVILGLVATREVSIARGARLAGLPLLDLLDLLGKREIVVIDYPAEDLEAEVERAQ